MASRMQPQDFCTMLVVLLLFSKDSLQQQQPQQQCKENEVFAACHNQFPPTCKEKSPQAFPVPCKPGCNCANGYIRESTDQNAKCIPVNQCPPVSNIQCGPNEIEKPCPTPANCAKTCANFKLPQQQCGQPCPVKGCECKPGFVRQQTGNVCIREQDCAFVTTGVPPVGGSLTTARPGQCKKHEVFAACHNQFPPTCVEKNPSAFPVPCKPGCNCANGYIRESAAPGAECIPVNRCTSNNGTIKCGPNEIEKDCPTPANCAKTCANFKLPPMQCGQPCPVKGCECKPGFVRQQTGNVCIREQDCAFVTTIAPSATTDREEPPLQCGSNEVLKRKHECPKSPECEAQCVQGDVRPSSCNTCNKKQRCECQDGYVRQKDHGAPICISNDDCAFNKQPDRA